MYHFIFVDDEDYIRELFQEIMDYREFGFELAASFSSAEQALAYIRQGNKVDAVLTDIRMGDLSGIELSEYIYADRPDIAVVIITGYGEFDYAQKAIRMGAVDYLLKPVEAETFAQVLENLEKMLDERGGKQEEQPEEILNPSALENIVEEIQSRYNENITLTGFSEKHNISAGHLSNLLKERLGMSFSEYITAKRVQKAKELLADERLSVEKVANEVGYKDYFYFTKVFKKAVGISPSKYRKNL